MKMIKIDTLPPIQLTHGVREVRKKLRRIGSSKGTTERWL
ncbi:hypothetical protein AWB75_03866 [Caballeronia catudaia]|uniref:Uncharacterized protein n=1 Tax=Caballeronia catudaia TaxID=1777136 RepID=A0A158BRK2_9BURK|nr:hypothetical protein AWB75_03866 [Caballeronia catudaia]